MTVGEANDRGTLAERAAAATARRERELIDELNERLEWAAPLVKDAHALLLAARGIVVAENTMAPFEVIDRQAIPLATIAAHLAIAEELREARESAGPEEPDDDDDGERAAA